MLFFLCARYTLLVHNHPITIAVVYLERRGLDGRPVRLEPGHHLVEAKCMTTKEGYPDACAALAVLKSKLAQVVELTKPSVHRLRPGDKQLMRAAPQLGLKHFLKAPS